MINNIHSTAIVEPGVKIGENSKVWHFCHIRSGATIENDCSIGRDCYIDSQVTIKSGTRIQNGVSIYNGVQVSEYVFIGPHVVFTNDMYPRAGSTNWEVSKTFLSVGSSLGAGAILRCGVNVGAFAMVGAGALVTKNIPQFTLAAGFPAKPMFRICACGRTKFDLGTDTYDYIQQCCYKYLKSEIIDLANSIQQSEICSKK